MVAFYARAQLQQVYGQASRTVRSVKNTYRPIRPVPPAFAASELPKMVVFYATARCHHGSLPQQCALATVLKLLVEHIRSSTKFVLNLGQRQALNATWIALSRVEPSVNNDSEHLQEQQREFSRDIPGCEFHSMTVQEPADSSASVDQGMIVKQLSILKRGDYWKHLPSEDGRESGPISGPSVPTLSSMDEEQDEGAENDAFPDKENIPHLRNRLDIDQRDLDYPDSHFAQGETRRRSPQASSHARSSVTSDNDERVLPVNGCYFYIRRVTEDGWLCAGSSETQHDDDVDCHLLRLPTKVAKLGCNGMKISGINLIKRQDNGVFEPFNNAENEPTSERLR